MLSGYPRLANHETVLVFCNHSLSKVFCISKCVSDFIHKKKNCVSSFTTARLIEVLIFKYGTNKERKKKKRKEKKKGTKSKMTHKFKPAFKKMVVEEIKRKGWSYDMAAKMLGLKKVYIMDWICSEDTQKKKQKKEHRTKETVEYVKTSYRNGEMVSIADVMKFCSNKFDDFKKKTYKAKRLWATRLVKKNHLELFIKEDVYQLKKKEAFEYAQEWSAESMAKKLLAKFEKAIEDKKSAKK